MACLDGIRMGARWPEREVMLESDNAVVVQKLKNPGSDRSLVAAIMRDAASESLLLKGLVVGKIGREQNKLAHETAHRAGCLGETKMWFADFPGCFITLACKDQVN